MESLYFCRSPYNFFTSSFSITKLVLEASKKDLKYLVLYEKDTLCGSLEFIIECKKKNIKPIICLELKIKNNKILFFPKNNKGFKELCYFSNLLSYHTNFLYKELNNITLSNIIAMPKNDKNEISDDNLDFFSKTKLDLKNNIYNIYFIDRIKKNDINIITLLHNLGNIHENEIELGLSLESIDENNDFFQLFNNIDINFEKRQIPLPSILTKQSSEFFKDLCMVGLKKRLKNSIVPKIYYDRLLMEIRTIKNKNLENYFLIFYDIVQFCYEKGILIGPGRGSAVGSLVSYCLHITNVDPIQFDLIFERFLNPTRSDLPDIDLDIEDSKRDVVIDYLYEKYGYNHVANITTYSTFGLKGAFREVAKFFGLNSILIKEISSFLPSSFSNLSLKNLLDSSNALLQKYVTNFTLKTTLDIAEKIKDVPRHKSIHAAGIILTKNNILTLVPLYLNKNLVSITQWKMNEIEAWGIPKFDLLGLRNLTIIKETIIAIYQNRGFELRLKELNKFDKKTFMLLAMGKVEGIFQLESQGMRKVLRKIKPNSIEEIALVSALFRPGAQSHIDECAYNKYHPKSIKKWNPIIDEILSTSYGVLVYQEQVIEIMVKFAGMSYSEADNMRRAISKKSKHKIKEIKKLFFNSCIQNKININLINLIWDEIIKFVSYGFNKSHAIAYAMISYWIMYLKVNYSLEFFTSYLTSIKMDHYKTLKMIINARIDFSINILSPNLNLSTTNYLIKKNSIIAPLDLIRNVGKTLVNLIKKERIQNGPYLNYINTIKRLLTISISKNTIINLIKGNALSNLQENTTTILHNLNKVIKYLKLGENSILKKPNIEIYKNNLKDLALWEKEVIGFNISCSIIDSISSQEKKNYTARKFFMIRNFNNVELPIIVFIENIKFQNTKNNKTMLILVVNDEIERINIYVFEETFIEEIQKNLRINLYCKLGVKWIKPYNNREYFHFTKIFQIYNI